MKFILGHLSDSLEENQGMQPIVYAKFSEGIPVDHREEQFVERTSLGIFVQRRISLTCMKGIERERHAHSPLKFFFIIV